MKYFCNIYIFLVMIFALQCINCKRSKRNLIFRPAKVQIIFGLGIPVTLDDLSVTMGYTLRAFYKLPSNVSDILHPSDILRRTIRSEPLRWNIYKTLAHTLERFGGKSCVLKSICELTSHKLDVSNGLMEELVDYTLRPSRTQEFSELMGREYFAAENIGVKTGGRCKYIYPECSISLVDMFIKRRYATVNKD